MPNKITKKYLDVLIEGIDNPEVCYTEKEQFREPITESQFETAVEGGCTNFDGANDYPAYYDKSCVIFFPDQPACLYCTYTISYDYYYEYTTTCYNTSTPDYWETQTITAWDNSAVSFRHLKDGESFSFVPTFMPHDIFIGLTDTLGFEHSYKNIKYGWNFNSQNGVPRAGVVYDGNIIYSEPYAKDTRFYIRKEKATIKLYIGGKNVATFWMGEIDNPPTEYKYYSSMLIDVALYSSGDYIENAIIEKAPSVCGKIYGSSTVLAGPTIGIGKSLAGAGIIGKATVSGCASKILGACVTIAGKGLAIASEFNNGLSARAAGKGTAIQIIGNTRARVSFEPLISKGSEFINNRVIVEFEPLESSSGIGLRDLAFNKIDVSFRPWYSNSKIISQQLLQSNTSFEPLISFSSDFNSAVSQVSFEPFRSFGGWFETADGTALLKVPSPYKLDAVGTTGKLSEAYLTTPEITISGDTGAQIYAVSPNLDITATGTTEVIGRANIDVPPISINAYGYVGAAGRAYLTTPGITVSGNSGANSNLTVPSLSFVGEGKLGTVLNSQIIVPDLTINASGTIEDFGKAELIVPPVSMLSGILTETWGSYSIQAHGYMEVVKVSDAFVMNTENKAITKYDNYPFNNIITSGNNVYGISETGLYLLGGDLDGISIINAEFELQPTNFKSIKTKNVPYGYISARAEDSFMVATRSDERINPYHNSTSHGRSDLYNWRSHFGRGVKGVNWGFSIKNINGSDFQIQSFTTTPMKHGRRL